MRAHAVVIGIDHYELHPDWELKGAVRDALKFAKWVTTRGNVAPADLTLLLSPRPGTAAITEFPYDYASSTAISKTFDAYLNEKAKDADRLWFFYAGHGLAAPGSGPSAGPMIVPANTDSITASFDRKTIELELFRDAMQNVKPSEQFYFVDACRDALDVQDHKTFTQRIYWDPRKIDSSKLATQVVFLATTIGKKAKELHGQGVFSRALLAALEGVGPELEEPQKAVDGIASLYFNSLDEFVQQAVQQALTEIDDLEEDERKEIVPYGTITKTKAAIEIAQFELEKLPKVKISAVVKPVDARSQAKIEFVEWSKNTGRLAPVADPAPVGPGLNEQHEFEVRSGKHTVRVEAPGYLVEPYKLVVFEEHTFLFKLNPAPSPEVPATMEDTDGGLESLQEVATGSLVAESPDRLTRLTVLDGLGHIHATGVGALAQTLDPGTYLLRAELVGVPTKEQEFVITRGRQTEVSVDIGDGRYSDPSENFGSIANAKFSSLLAYAAWAARWPPAEGFNRLRSEGVDPLPQVEAGGTALQVLIGDAMDEGASFLDGCHVQLESETGERTPIPLAPLATLHARQGSFIAAAGPVRVRVEMPGFVATTFALTLLPNLVTVLIVARESNGNVEVQQHFNPIDPMVPVHPLFDTPQKDDVRVVEIGARALEHREPLADNEYQRLVGKKGSNPMLGLIAGYRMRRSDRAKDFGGKPLRNMLAAFPGLPDVHVLAGLYDEEKRDEHFARAMKAGTPVFAEGFWALFEWMTERAVKDDDPPPVLSRELTAGMVWTSFIDALPAEKAERVRIVTATGRTSLAAITEDRGVTITSRSVGRIETGVGPFVSTAFLVAPRIALTPVHVAQAFAKPNAKGGWKMTRPATIRFDETNAVPIVRVVRTVRPRRNAKVLPGSVDAAMLDICWPVVLLLAEDAPFPPLTFAEQAADIGERVSVIGFPFDAMLGDDLFTQHFGGASGEKHVMPGVITRTAGETWTFDHNCFTAPGTSGGPIVNHSGLVVGMHVAALASRDGFKQGVGMAMTRFAKDVFVE